MKGKWNRYARAESVRRHAISIDAEHILHITSLSLPLISKDKKRKHYLYLDSTWESWRRYTDDLGSYHPKLIEDIEASDRRSFLQADHIFTTAHYLRSNLIDHYGIKPSKITAVGTGPGAIAPFFGSKSYDNRTILFVAKNRFSQKGRALTIEAFDRAVRRDPRLRLIVAGDPTFVQPPDTPNLEVKGFVDLKELQNLFETSSLFVLPATNEPWGLVYIEALLCKVPVVGLWRNALPEITNNGAYGFLLSDPPDGDAIEELANIFATAFSDLESLAKKGRDGQQACLAKYTWANVANSMVSTIGKLPTGVLP